MATREAAQGFAEAYGMFDRLPNAAEQEMIVELGIIGRELLAAQEADAPVGATGQLKGALAFRVLTQRLQVRVGLLRGARASFKFNGRTFKAKQGGPFYGRIVEFGRKGQTVVVTRRIKQRRLRGNNRGSSRRGTVFRGASDRLRRRGPNRGTPIGSPYKLKVKARGAGPFVLQPLLEDIADAHLGEFWAGALARLGNVT